jgi:hypothetical protein
MLNTGFSARLAIAAAFGWRSVDAVRLGAGGQIGRALIERAGDAALGLARLTAAIAAELAAARQHSEQTGKPARRFKDFTWSTLDSWSATRRVIGKAEWTGGEANPRFVVTSLARNEHEARHLYEKVYCARGDMENRIKECQLGLFADRTSAKTMRANQLRLWFAAMAYVLVCALRQIALRHTQFAEATCGTIRLKLFKIGALVRVSFRRVKIAMASACLYQNEFALAHLRLTAAARWPGTDVATYPLGSRCPDRVRHDSPRLRAGALATIPCTARTTASN